ncbi:DsbA family protein [Gracilimonas sp.]|uniref:DsbA family protein n=1 Tax=Gracilimonas sp. TaxID=1974203 RepID=UPI003D09BC8B
MSDLYAEISEEDYFLGNPDAKLTLLEYGDYECPYSRLGYRFSQMLLKKYKQELRFVFRNFPLRKKHPNAQLAAEAALCAGAQDRFWEMHNLLFKHNRRLSENRILEFAEDIGLDLYRFKVNLTTNEFASRVTADFRGGVKSGVDDTPTFFVNGERYSGELDYKQLKAFVDTFLN